MIQILNKSNSVFNQYLSEIRDKDIQKDSMRFRRNLERMGAIFAYEISKTMVFNTTQIQTQLGIAEENVPSEDPVIISLMRAGLPIQQGMIDFFDKAQNGFITAFRNHTQEDSFQIKLEYISCPDINGKILILADAMIASGATIELAYKALLQKGSPKHTHIVSLIASKEGISHLKKKLHESKVTFWVGAIDDELTVKSFVVPGLGDAGDLAFGAKTSKGI
jgi:uracil phosphoribosyltransferase